MSPLAPPDQMEIDDIILHARMADAGADGQSSRDGVARMISPFSCNLRSIGVHVEGGLDVPTSFDVATIADPVRTSPLAEPRLTAQGQAAFQSFGEVAPFHLSSMEMFEVRSGGEASAGRPAHCFATMSREGFDWMPENLFIYSGCIPDGTASFDINIPIADEMQLISIQLGAGEEITGTLALGGLKNGQSFLGASNIPPGAAGRTSQLSTFDSLGGNKGPLVMGRGDYLQMVSGGNAGLAGSHPFNVIFARR